MVRPADANEVSQAWQQIILNKRAAGLILSRQNLPVLETSANTKSDSNAGVRNGAYVIWQSSDKPTAAILATGSEVPIAIEAAKKLKGKNISTRVISFPCFEWFDRQPESYRKSVLPDEITVRVSVEAGIAMPWHKYIGTDGVEIGRAHV